MRVLVCGSRTFNNRWLVPAMLFGLQGITGDDPDFVVIDGAAQGADSMANEWAVSFDREFERYPADWDKHGKAAGPIRNAQMLLEGKPDLVVAFLDKPRVASRGTNDMITKAENAGVPIIIVQWIPGKETSFG